MELLCQRCGYPHCQCAACGKKQVKHTCWLCFYGPHPLSKNVDPITNKRVPPEHQAARAVAWHHVHSSLPQALQWDGQNKMYKFALDGPGPAAKKRKKCDVEDLAGQEAGKAEDEAKAEEEEAGGSEKEEVPHASFK